MIKIISKKRYQKILKLEHDRYFEDQDNTVEAYKLLSFCYDIIKDNEKYKEHWIKRHINRWLVDNFVIGLIHKENEKKLQERIKKGKWS